MRAVSITLAALTLLAGLNSQAIGKPRVYEVTGVDPYVDIVGPVEARVAKAQPDTVWFVTWTFEDAGGNCDDTGWERADHRILNDGQIYWHVSDKFDGIANISGNAAVLSNHDLCWEIPDGYGNDWIQGICMRYFGNSYLSFDWLVDSEPAYQSFFGDWFGVWTDSACASFELVDHTVQWPRGGTAQTFRDRVWFVSGFDTLTARVDSLLLRAYSGADTHCVYIEFVSDHSFSAEDGLVQTALGAGAVVDNVILEGPISTDEDFTDFIPGQELQLVNLQDTEPFGLWARLYRHVSDNDTCTENTTCSWLHTDYTTPTTFAGVSMNFGPGGFIVRNWLDEIVTSPWATLPQPGNTVGTVIQFRRFPGSFFGTGKIVQNWSMRSRKRIANTDTSILGDSIECVTSWSHAFQWNSLGLFRWITSTWDATDTVASWATEVQVRIRISDWQWIAGSGYVQPFNPGPGPYWDRMRIGRLVGNVPFFDEGIDARTQAQDAAPNDPTHEAGPMYAQLTGQDDLFGTVAFSRGGDLGVNELTPNLIVGDSITVTVTDLFGTGGVEVALHAAIVAGPHAGKAPPPYTVGGNGFFVVPADSARQENGAIAEDVFFVDLDDTYFRGGDALRYFWYATDLQGNTSSLPIGLNALPIDLTEAEAATGGLFEVNFLPAITWDPEYLERIQEDTHGDLEPTSEELANSSQANCILYYQNVNSRRRSGDVNRTSFMYTLDELGYQGVYDIYDHMGLGNTNNQIGARMSPEQARGYSLIVYDAGNRATGAPIMPDGIDIDLEKINMQQWFVDYVFQSGGANPAHTLWIIGSNVVQEKPTLGLYNNTMGVLLIGTEAGEGPNPNVFGTVDFTNGTGCAQAHNGDAYVLQGGCPVIRDYDALGETGTAVKTHVYGEESPSMKGAMVMNTPGGNATTILTSHAWSDIRDPQGGIAPPGPEEPLLATILSCVLDSGCEAGDPTGGGDVVPPARTALHQNVPNPFNPATEIRFDLAEDAHVSLRVYDAAGRLVRTLVNENLVAGYEKRYVWHGLDDRGQHLPSGVYFYRLVTGSHTSTRKLVMLR